MNSWNKFKFRIKSLFQRYFIEGTESHKITSIYLNFQFCQKLHAYSFKETTIDATINSQIFLLLSYHLIKHQNLSYQTKYI